MKKANNLISVLIINYNNEKYVSRAIKSCLNQSYKNLEILVYDDNSTDNSKYIIKKFKKNKKIKIYFNKKKKKNIPAFDAANGYIFLFKKSKGKIICLLDSDDFFHKNKLKQLFNFFSKNKEKKFVQNLPIEINNKVKHLKKNKNSFLSYWPYLPPESCISFRRNFMNKFLIKNNKLRFKFKDVWLGFRMGLFAFFIEENFATVEKNLTFYKGLGESNKYKKFGLNWFVRRKNSFDYLYKISNKEQKYLINLDYIITLIISFIFRFRKL